MAHVRVLSKSTLIVVVNIMKAIAGATEYRALALLSAITIAALVTAGAGDTSALIAGVGVDTASAAVLIATVARAAIFTSLVDMARLISLKAN